MSWDYDDYWTVVLGGPLPEEWAGYHDRALEALCAEVAS